MAALCFDVRCCKQVEREAGTPGLAGSFQLAVSTCFPRRRHCMMLRPAFKPNGALLLQVRSHAYCARSTCDTADSTRKVGTDDEILLLLALPMKRLGTAASGLPTLPDLLANWRKRVSD